MPVIACPATVMNAPVERVWSFLIEPRRWDAWADARFEAALPDGPTHAGQRWRLTTRGLGRRWAVWMDITRVTTAPHSLGLQIALPLGIRNEEHITLAPLADGRTRVQFN